MRQAWAAPGVAEAIEVATPSLADRISAICAGDPVEPRQVHSAAVSLARYLLRMRHRSTPFGLFAGIAPAHFGSRFALRWGHDHRPVARADAAWLAEVISQLEACPDLLHRLHVVVDPTHVICGDFLVVAFQQPPPATGPRRSRQVKVRHTPALRTLVEAARTPIAFSELSGKLAAAYPHSSSTAIDELLAGLVSARILLTVLHPPMTVVDGLAHLNRQLAAAQAENIPRLATTIHTLREVQTALDRHVGATSAEHRHLRGRARQTMRTLSTIVDHPVTVDLHLDCELVLPEAVAHEAERAAAALTRLTSYPSGAPGWLAYHAAFLDRYGPGALVPVLNLTDPHYGLGLPAGYRSSLREPPARSLTSRDEQLLAIAQRSALDGARELNLSDHLVKELTLRDDITQPPHLDLCFHLHAPTRQALQGGDFTLVVASLTSTAGASVGRFLDLLSPPERARFLTSYAELPTLTEGALHAHLSSPPLHARTENVSRAPRTWPTLICVGEYNDFPALALSDLAVTADPHRFRLVSISTGQTIEPAVLNTVEASNFAHPLARFLSELPRAHTAVFGAFPWGAARHLPYLPRIRYGRSILSPARWRLQASELPAVDASWDEWRKALDKWQRRHGTPGAVLLGDDDRCLRLNLEESAHLQLLRADLTRAGHATLREAPEQAAYGWFDGRAHEITVTLASTRPPAPARPRSAVAVIRRDHGHLPGASSWAFAKLYGHRDMQTPLLTAHLPELLAAGQVPPQWWFVRYRDPEDHLRLRIQLPTPAMFTQVIEQVGAWAATLRRLGLINRMAWDTYVPETGRFGTGPAMGAAEGLFAADSTTAVTQLTHPGVGHRQVLTAASFIDLAIAFIGDVDAAMRWLVDHLSNSSAVRPPRSLHQEARRVADPRGNFAALRQLPGGEEVLASWAARRHAAAYYRDQLRVRSDIDPDYALGSLLHLHHNRMAGADQEDEYACTRLARTVALSFCAQAQSTHR
ncbi:lantibiotic dehydratase [Sinosporangium siamense]|uniref:Lantibiotic dehydratase n=1 Tax=Sinosporangium siamense TaxID=1367973 RepID=A0A919VAQ7_9ACTN|nr:lantibiotic dehydratase [Sinosporangium siamense]GII91354.1 hypothetical protein Ssi02_15850 [Sinosporangium siamense]